MKLIVVLLFILITSVAHAGEIGINIKFTEPCSKREVVGKIVEWTTGAYAHPIVKFEDKLYELTSKREGSGRAEPMGWQCEKSNS